MAKRSENEVDTGTIFLFVVLGVILGIFIALAFFPTTVTKTIRVPYAVDKIVKVPYEVEVEVEVPGQCTNTNIEIDELLLDVALKDFMDAIDDEEVANGNPLECDGDEFDFDEISISDIDDEYSISYDKDEITVTFSTKLKYKESDVRSCRETYDVEVFYEEDEDVEVSLI